MRGIGRGGWIDRRGQSSEQEQEEGVGATMNSSEGKMLLAEGGANAKARRWKCTEQGQGAAKRLVWKDLLQVKSELRGRPDATEPTRNRKDKLLCL